MTFTVDSALAYLRSKLSEFYAQSGRLTQELIRAGQLKVKAQQAGRGDLVDEATKAQTTLRRLLTEQLSWEGSIKDLASYFGMDNRLSAVPVAILAVAVPLAVFMYSYLQDSWNAAKRLDLVEQGLLTGEQATAIERAGLTASLADIGQQWGTPILVLVGVAAVFYFGFGRK